MLSQTIINFNSCTIAFDVDEQRYLLVSTGFSGLFETEVTQLHQNVDFLNTLIDKKDQEYIDSLTQTLRQDQTIELNYTITTPKGTVKHLTEKRAFTIDALTLHRVITSTISIKQPDITQATLSEQFLNSVIDSQTNLLMRGDVDGNFTFVNRQFLKTFGYTRDEIIGKHFSITTIPEQRHLCEEAFVECISNPGKIVKLLHKKPDKAGNLHDTEWELIAIVNDKGEAIEVQGIGHDVTEQKQAQEKVMLIKNSLEALINNTHDHIWSVDSELRYVYMNHAYIKQVKLFTGENPKKGDYSYLHSGYSQQTIDEWNSYYERALNGERYSIISKSIDPLIDEPLFFEVSFNPIYAENDGIIGVGCFAHDTTPRLKIEQELVDQNDRLRNIASLSSHELRRPVASMMGLINLMDRKNFYNPENKSIIEHLLTVSTEIDDVIRLIVDSTFTGDLPV